jgi:hypothetical protein
MKHKYNWDLEYLDNLLPWQRDIYIDLTIAELEKDAK